VCCYIIGKQTNLILKMVSANHNLRPTASEILSALDDREKPLQEKSLSKCDCCESFSQKLMAARLEIEDLTRQLAEKNAIIERLSMSH